DESVADMAGDQQRIARYQVKPREKPAEEPPKPRDASGVQEGAKAREEEGKLGKPEAKKKEAAPSRKGSPVTEPDKRESDRRKVMRLGLVAALSKMGATASGASNVLGPGGLGTGINHALGGVKGGAGPGDAYGVGGLGSRGTGQGGGGTAIGIGGLGTKGTGGGRGGWGDVDLGGRGKEETQFVPGRTIVIGGLSGAARRRDGAGDLSLLVQEQRPMTRLLLAALLLSSAARAGEPDPSDRSVPPVPSNGIDESPRRGTFAEASLGVFATLGGSRA